MDIIQYIIKLFFFQIFDSLLTYIENKVADLKRSLSFILILLVVYTLGKLDEFDDLLEIFVFENCLIKINDLTLQVDVDFESFVLQIDFKKLGIFYFAQFTNQIVTLFELVLQISHEIAE